MKIEKIGLNEISKRLRKYTKHKKLYNHVLSMPIDSAIKITLAKNKKHFSQFIRKYFRENNPDFKVSVIRLNKGYRQFALIKKNK